MRLNSKVAVLVAGAMLVLASSVAMAHAAAAAQQSVALQVGDASGTGFSGGYGDEIVLQPASMTSIERPGEKFHFQAYVSNVDSMGVSVGMQWTDFMDLEDIQLEDTNTVLPFVYSLGVDDAIVLGDGTIVHPTPPYLIRCEYKALDESGTANSTAPKSFSETVTVSAQKSTNARVRISTRGTVRRAGTYFNFQVSPNCGVSKIRVTVKKSGSSRSYTLTTNENGSVNAKLKLGTSNGTYKVYAKFLGNLYGAPSATAVKNVRASR